MSKITEKQQIINELQADVTSPEDQAYLDQLQQEHDEARQRLGLAPQNPALEHIESFAIKGAMHQVDGAGHVTKGDKPATNISPYEDGRRA